MANTFRGFDPLPRPGTGQPTFVWWILGAMIVMSLILLWGTWSNRDITGREQLMNPAEDTRFQPSAPDDGPGQPRANDVAPDHPPVGP